MVTGAGFSGIIAGAQGASRLGGALQTRRPGQPYTQRVPEWPPEAAAQELEVLPWCSRNVPTAWGTFLPMNCSANEPALSAQHVHHHPLCNMHTSCVCAGADCTRDVLVGPGGLQDLGGNCASVCGFPGFSMTYSLYNEKIHFFEPNYKVFIYIKYLILFSHIRSVIL